MQQSSLTCRLLAQSGLADRAAQCPLLEVKPTFCGRRVVAVNDPRQARDNQVVERAFHTAVGSEQFLFVHDIRLHGVLALRKVLIWEFRPCLCTRLNPFESSVGVGLTSGEDDFAPRLRQLCWPER